MFTKHLIEGMKGAADENGNGFVSLLELSRYVQRAVADETKDEQRPAGE